MIVSFLAVTAAAYAILVSGTPHLGVKLGRPASRDFSARTSFECLDVEATEAVRERAGREAPLVFRRTQAEFRASEEALLTALEEGQDSRAWEQIEDASVREQLLAALPTLRDRRDLIEQALTALRDMLVVRPSHWGENAPRQPEHVMLLDDGAEDEKVHAAREVVQLSPSSERFRMQFEEVIADMPAERQEAVLAAFADLVRPTMVLDDQRTSENAELASRAEKPVVKTVRKGKLIVAKGAEVRQHHMAELQIDREQYGRSREGRLAQYRQLLGLGVLLLVVAWAGGFYILRYRPELPRSGLQRFAFGLLTLALVGITRLLLLLDLQAFLVPVPLVVMVLCLVYDQRFGFETAALYGLLVGIAYGGTSLDFIVLMLGGMTAALLTGHVRTRSVLIKAGLVAGCVQWASVWGLALMTASAPLSARFWADAFVSSLGALGNGVISGFLVSGLLPTIERLFGITTDIRLLEWSDPNQPLLQRLLVEAPGTYHHSMIVGSLAAEAAEATGANPLLARVSAYFHDIGKLKKPEYFGENLPKDKKSPHEQLSPTMSRLIITAHPRDGAEMAQQGGLPKEVRDIILESHGSTITRYFWDIAKQRGAEDTELDESDFRYKLPKPSSKEAACVMLADAAESASRSLNSPSAAKIADVVHELILDRLHDGQLNESGLTITDLERTEAALIHGLNAVFHSRIRYPGQQEEQESTPEKDNEAVSDSGSQPTG